MRRAVGTGTRRTRRTGRRRTRVTSVSLPTTPQDALGDIILQLPHFDAAAAEGLELEHIVHTRVEDRPGQHDGRHIVPVIGRVLVGGWVKRRGRRDRDSVAAKPPPTGPPDLGEGRVLRQGVPDRAGAVGRQDGIAIWGVGGLRDWRALVTERVRGWSRRAWAAHKPSPTSVIVTALWRPEVLTHVAFVRCVQPPVDGHFGPLVDVARVEGGGALAQRVGGT